MNALAATLREAEPGTKVRLVLKNGREVSGTLCAVNGESVDLDDDGSRRVDLSQVKRLNLEFSSAPGHSAPGKQAA
jgi:hypothetical protein